MSWVQVGVEVEATSTSLKSWLALHKLPLVGFVSEVIPSGTFAKFGGKRVALFDSEIAPVITSWENE